MSTVNFDNELSRRPDNSILTEAWERGTNLWSEELFRRMNHDEAKVDRVPLPPLPDTLEEWEKAKPGILQAFKDCLYGDMPPAPDKLELRLLAAKPDASAEVAHVWNAREADETRGDVLGLEPAAARVTAALDAPLVFRRDLQVVDVELAALHLLVDHDHALLRVLLHVLPHVLFCGQR